LRSSAYRYEFAVLAFGDNVNAEKLIAGRRLEVALE
jgi:hypothetical protein